MIVGAALATLNMASIEGDMIVRRFTGDKLKEETVLEAAVIAEEDRLDEIERHRRNRKSLYQDNEAGARYTLTL